MIFENYPKKRPELPAEYQKIYTGHYKKNRDGKTSASALSQKMEAWMHKKVAEDLKGKTDKSTLEIGAGTLNQLDYENTRPYDIVEPFTELFSKSTSKSRVDCIYDDINDIELTKSYDRITSVATFEHIADLPAVIAKTCLLLNKSGTLRVSIPNEGTFLWKLGYSLTTGIEFRLLYGLDYEVLMKYEHLNTADEVEQIIRYFYQDIKTSYLGIHKKMAFYKFFECKNPIADRANKYIALLR